MYCALSVESPQRELKVPVLCRYLDAEDFDVDKGFAGGDEWEGEDKELDLAVSGGGCGCEWRGCGHEHRHLGLREVEMGLNRLFVCLFVCRK